jgi:hypothetical protein
MTQRLPAPVQTPIVEIERAHMPKVVYLRTHMTMPGSEYVCRVS